MYKVAVMGDYDSIYGFAAIGFDVFDVSEEDEARKKLRNIAESGYAVIYITEELAGKIPGTIEKYKDSVTPAIIPIPGLRGNTGSGIANVKSFVEQAVGSDILFTEKN